MVDTAMVDTAMVDTAMVDTAAKQLAGEASTTPPATHDRRNTKVFSIPAR